MTEHNQYLLQVADRFLKLSVPIILVHGVGESGTCSCGNAKCENIGKHPVKDKPATTQLLDVAELEAELKSNKPRNIAGWITKDTGLIVIDVDKKNGGLESFRKFEETYGFLPGTLKVLSGGGGFHLYFRLPADFEKIHLAGILNQFEGIDFIRNKNIVLPGSRHYSGNQYSFDVNAESTNFQIAELPKKFVELLLTKQSKSKVISSKSIPDGKRNSTLYVKAVKMFSSGSCDESVLNALDEMNSNLCQPPLSSDEIKGILESAQKKKESPFQVYSFEENGTSYNADEHPKILSNFHGIIDEQIEINDGSVGPSDMRYKIKILMPQLSNGEIIVTPEQLEDGSWVPKTDASLIILGANTYRQHIRVALRTLGNLENRRKVFINLGWAEVDGQAYFLANNGAIGACGFTDRYFTSVDFGGPGGYEILEATSEQELQEIFQSVNQLLAVTKPEVTVPLFASVFRAPLIKFFPTDFCIGVFGQTGSMKSTIVGLFTSFYGSQFSYNNLPESFSSTANSIERRSFLTYSSLLVVDDWVPGESSKYKAEAVLRSQGNRQGRGRLNQDATLKKTYFPRSLTIVTGEDLQVEQSLRARLVILEMQKGSVNKPLLTQLQRIGKNGGFNKFLGSYIRWIIQNESELQNSIAQRTELLRDEFNIIASDLNDHARTAPNLAHLLIGLETFGQFCLAKNLMTTDQHYNFIESSRSTLIKLIDIQSKHQELTDPVNRFIDSLKAILEKGDVHIRHSPSLQAGSSKYLGYINSGSYGFNSQGECIGEIINDELCLRKGATYAAVKGFSFRRGEPIVILERGMTDRLLDRGIIINTHDNRSTLKRTVDGVRERCWVIPNWRQIFLPRVTENLAAPMAPQAPPQMGVIAVVHQDSAISKDAHDTSDKKNLH